jgi:hypothetical protein
MNPITGLLFIFMLFVFHVIIRKLRSIEETHYVELDRIRMNLVKIGEWMVSFDIGLGRLFEKTGLMEEGASIDEALRAFVKEAEEKSWMTMPQEKFEETMERLSKEDLAEELQARDHIIPALPNLAFRGSWRETAAYKSPGDQIIAEGGGPELDLD